MVQEQSTARAYPVQVVQAAFFFVVLLQGTVPMELPEMDSVIAIMFLASTWLPFANKDTHAQTCIFKDNAFFCKFTFGSTCLYAFCAYSNTDSRICASSTHTKLNIQVEVCSLQGIFFKLNLLSPVWITYKLIHHLKAFTNIKPTQLTNLKHTGQKGLPTSCPEFTVVPFFFAVSLGLHLKPRMQWAYTQVLFFFPGVGDNDAAVGPK